MYYKQRRQYLLQNSNNLINNPLSEKYIKYIISRKKILEIKS